jgi:hypothetical protein
VALWLTRGWRSRVREMDWTDLLVGGIATIVIEIVFVFLAPDSWKEPVASAVRRARKWWNDTKVELTFARQLVVQDDLTEDQVRDRVDGALRESGFWTETRKPTSYEFGIATTGVDFGARVSVIHDPMVESGEPVTLQLTLSASTSYRSLRATFQDLTSAESIARRGLQHGPRFVESRPQVRLKLLGAFPMTGFFQDVEPIILGCQTRDGAIEFDYSPGILTVRAELDSHTFTWVRNALTAL